MVEKHYLDINAKHQIGASPFEILTATAFTIFNDANIKVGVVEVGMGGTLDSTNILNNQAVSVISKIARDHEGFLGNTLSEIAGHKAGILRPDVPYIVNSDNEGNVQDVIDDYAQEIGAGPRLTTSAFEFNKKLYSTAKWERITAPLEPFQQENLKLASVAVSQTLQSLNRDRKPMDLVKVLLSNVKKHHQGRQEMVRAVPVFRHANERKNHILVDGAHNPDAATVLNDFIRNNLRYGQSPARERPASGWPVTWVLAMTEGKDAREYLAKLLKPGDNVVTTSFGPVDGMPWVKPMDPKELLQIAKSIVPDITGVHVPVLGPLRALCTAKYLSNQLAPWAPIVLTGSLYLVGDFHRELRARSSPTWWSDTDEATAADREAFMEVQAAERERADAVLGSRKAGPSNESGGPEGDELRKLQEEVDALNLEVQGLEIEEKRLVNDYSTDTPEYEQSLSALERFEREDRRFAELHSTPEQIAAQIKQAEKAEAALVRHAEKLEIAAKARAEKLAERAERQERLEQRKERRLEKKELAKQEKELRKLQQTQGRDQVPWEETPTRISLREQASHSAQSSLAREDSPKYRSAQRRDTSKTFSANGNKILTFYDRRDTRPLKPSAAPEDAPEDALSILFKPDQKNSFFSNSNSSAPSPAPAPPSPPPQPTPSANTNPETTNPEATTTPGPKIHMHYANVAEPHRRRMQEFPADRKTRAWKNHRRTPHPGYKTPARPSVVNYYEHEYGLKPGA